MMHHQATMKVGTDAVLLGAWASVAQAGNILDAGTGSGILALMAAQRNPSATICAIDVDGPSVAEAARNFARSPWSTRLSALQADLRSYQPSDGRLYDLILSNPPFFDRHFLSGNIRRNLARHTDTLSYEHLLEACSRLLDREGLVAIVLPWNASMLVEKLAPQYGLWPCRKQLIIPVAGRNPNRVNLELAKIQPQNPTQEYFVIREADRQFSIGYKRLLNDFYLGLGV